MILVGLRRYINLIDIRAEDVALVCPYKCIGIYMVTKLQHCCSLGA